MSTGDIKNNLRKLQTELKLVKIEKDVDMENLSKGIAAAFLPIYHYVFLNYSRPLAELISNINIDMYGKSDLKFLESMYKVLRELFSYKPPVTKEQFFSSGFVERKLIMGTEVLAMVREKHKSMMPKPAVRYTPKSHSSSPTQPIVCVASARPAVSSDSPLSTKERGKPALDGSHSDKLLTQEIDTTPLRALTFPTTNCPTIQKTLNSIMQSQRDMNARIISLENSLASANKTDLDQSADDRSLGSAPLENILARLTLLENRMADVDVKKGTNSELHHSIKSAADDTFDTIRVSSKLRGTSGMMDVNSPGKDDLAEGDYSPLSDTAFSGDPTHRINELLKQTEEMLEKSQATAAFS